MKHKHKQKVSAKGGPAPNPPIFPASGSGYSANRPDNPWLVPGICIFLAAIIWIVYGQSLHFQFVNYDDNQFVFGNATVLHGMTLKGVASAFRAHGMDNWIPMATLSHMLDCQFYGLNAGGHHLTNVLLHTAAAILLFLVLRRMTSALWRSAFVASLFAIHPLGVESVAWVTERKDILSGLFLILTLGAYTGYVRNRSSFAWYMAALLFAALGLMSKPMLVTLPFALLLLDYWPLQRFSPSTARRLLVEKIPFLLLSTAACFVTFAMQQKTGAVKTLASVPMPIRIENTFVSYMRYLGKIFYPENLAVLYPRQEQWPLVLVVLSAVLFIVISAAAIASRKRFPFVFTGWFWFAGMLVPVIGLIQVGEQAMADRYVYLPQIGLYLLLAWLVAELTPRLPYRAWLPGSLSSVIVAALICRAHAQASYWQNSEALWTHTLACTRDNLIAHYNFGNALLQKGDVNGAIIEYREALKVDSHNAVARNNLGTALLQKREADEAMHQYRQAIQDDPGYILARINLANQLLPEGQVDEAIDQYREALKIDPEDPAALHNLGNALLQNGDVDEAIAQYQAEIKVNADYALAHYNLGNALAQKGQLDSAITEYLEALKLDPGYALAHANLANVLWQKGQVDEAVDQYQQALKINPDDAAAHNNLGAALLQKRRFNEAAAQFLAALKIKPESVDYQNAAARSIWILSTSENPNGSDTIAMAIEANQLTSSANPVILRVLAAAYAQSGDFHDAIETAHSAIAIATQQQITPLVAALQHDLAIYERGSPVRENNGENR
jgi:tetratricopeptide (TPR) repeat protein